MSAEVAPDVLIIGVGNRDRGDDGIGLLIAAQLRERGLPHVRILDAGADLLSLIDVWSSETFVILLDAAQRQGRVGTIHRIDALREPLPPGPARPSTHALDLADVIALARVLGRLPGRLIIYAIEGECFARGAALSAPVAAAAEEVACRVGAEAASLRAVRAARWPPERVPA